eukprot:gene8608-9485_t
MKRIIRPFHSFSSKFPSGIGLYGICEDRNSSYLRGPALAPPLIRTALHCPSSNAHSEVGIEVLSRIQDYGDLTPSQPDSRVISEEIQPRLEAILRDDRLPLALGGDHSLTFPILLALHKILCQPVTVIHFDAHPDCYPLFEGNLWSHASPFARVVEEEGLCQQLVSIGIRTASPEQRDFMKTQPIKWIEAKHFPSQGSGLRDLLSPFIPSQDSLVYVSIDLDVLEPGLAPGVSHHEPGGLTVRQLIDAIHCLPGRVVGADVVEYNPRQEMSGSQLTAFVAAKIVKELSARALAPDLTHSY